MKKTAIRFHLLVLFFSLLTSFGFAQNMPGYAVGLIPAELKENALAVVREEKINFDVSAPGKAQYTLRRIITIFDEKSDYRNLVIHYDPARKIGKIKARVYDAMGNLIKKIDKDDIKDYSAVSDFSIYEDDRYKHIRFFNNILPFTVEYEYDLTYSGIRQYPSWQIMDYQTAVEKASYSVVLPANLDISQKAFNIALEPQQDKTTTGTTFHWQVSNLAAIKEEPLSPNQSDILPWVAVVPHQFETEGYSGSMTDWAAFGKFMYQLNKGRDVLSPEMAAKVKELTANAKTNAEKINILYRFLQENTRYVSVQLGIGGWQTFDAKYVEKNKYGDCKALTNFMKSMLKEAGIQAYPTLIAPGENQISIDDNLALPYFNHVILNIPSEHIWLECTSSDFPANYLGYSNADRNVLRITEQGGQLVRTPKQLPENNTTQTTAIIKIDESGAARISDSLVFKGAQHELYRYLAAQYSEEEQRKWFLKNSSLPSMEIVDWQLKATPDQPMAVLRFQVNVPKFTSRAGQRFFVPINMLHPFTDIPAETENRHFPVSVAFGYVEKDHFTFEIPEGYEVESYPSEPLALQSPYGQYQLKVTVTEGLISCERELQIIDGQFPAAEYKAIRQFYKEVANEDAGKMVLKKKKT